MCKFRFTVTSLTVIFHIFMIVFSMDSVGMNLIKTAALGRPFQLGMLYDFRNDELIAGSKTAFTERYIKKIIALPFI